MVKASDLLPGMYKLVSMLQVEMLWRQVLWKIDRDVVGHCLQHPNNIVFSRTSLSLTKWQHVKHSSGIYTIQLELIQPPEELEEATVQPQLSELRFYEHFYYPNTSSWFHA